MITELVDLLKSGETPEPETTLEKLEQKNTENASERHILEFEEYYDSQLFVPRVAKELTTTVIASQGINYILLSAIEAVGFSFSPIPTSLITLGVNLATAAITSDNRKKIGQRFLLGGCKFTVNTAINGSLVWRTTEKHSKSVEVVEAIKAEIAAYENGYKQQPGLPLESLLIGSILIGLVLIGLKRK